MSCRMLQGHVVKMLAGLLENDINRMWSFDRFFDEVTIIDTMIVLKIFYGLASQQLLVYLRKTDTYVLSWVNESCEKYDIKGASF